MEGIWQTRIEGIRKGGRERAEKEQEQEKGNVEKRTQYRKRVGEGKGKVRFGPYAMAGMEAVVISSNWPLEPLVEMNWLT